jgi:hypothetical protein
MLWWFIIESFPLAHEQVQCTKKGINSLISICKGNPFSCGEWIVGDKGGSWFLLQKSRITGHLDLDDVREKPGMAALYTALAEDQNDGILGGKDVRGDWVLLAQMVRH